MPQTRYEFRVSGHMSENACYAFTAFEGLRVVPAPPEVIIYGTVADEAQLHEILVLLDDLGLNIVSVQRIPTVAE